MTGYELKQVVRDINKGKVRHYHIEHDLVTGERKVTLTISDAVPTTSSLEDIARSKREREKNAVAIVKENKKQIAHSPEEGDLAEEASDSDTCPGLIAELRDFFENPNRSASCEVADFLGDAFLFTDRRAKRRQTSQADNHGNEKESKPKSRKVMREGDSYDYSMTGR